MRQRRLVYLVLVLASSQGVLAAATPEAVSPGRVDAVALIESRCPTFSWSRVPGAESHNLVVYALGEQGIEARPVLSEAFAGSVFSWTPSLDRCLERGGRYAWSVQAPGIPETSDWSEAKFFQISEGPSPAEVEDALSVLRRYQRSQAEGDQADGTSLELPPSPGVLRAERPRTEKNREASTESPEQKSLEILRPSRRVPPVGAAAPVLGSAPSITVDDQIHLGGASHIFKDSSLFLWNEGTNLALGQGALGNNTTGFSNTAAGNSALYYNTTGYSNTAAGASALELNTAGSRNTAMGWEALYRNTTGSRNTAIGSTALYSNTEGGRNTAAGQRALYSNTTGSRNTAIGYASLRANKTGVGNTAMGQEALYRNTTGYGNTASGSQALFYNTSGYGNTASGRGTLASNTTGVYNTAIGFSALFYNTTGRGNSAIGKFALVENTDGDENTANGSYALRENTTGYKNTAIGKNALFSVTTGDRNTALGAEAGKNAQAGNDNIFIGSGAYGSSLDARTIRIGGTAVGSGQGQQQRAFINGIRGVTTGVNNAVPVLIDSAGQLGTASSSRRYKEDIESMGGISERLLALRPVEFRYRKAFANGEKPVQFGLIAEEVAEVFPELVVYNEEGEPETVKYHLLSTLLLNELQEQARQNVMQWGLMGLMLLAGLTVTVRHIRFG